jgi:hypothetical protein
MGLVDGIQRTYGMVDGIQRIYYGMVDDPSVESDSSKSEQDMQCMRWLHLEPLTHLLLRVLNEIKLGNRHLEAKSEAENARSGLHDYDYGYAYSLHDTLTVLAPSLSLPVPASRRPV